MRMLTPKALGQSLREIAKLGGALGREGQAAKGGGSEGESAGPRERGWIDERVLSPVSNNFVDGM